MKCRGLRRAVLAGLVGVLSLVTWSTAGWAATRLGNAELLAWYRTRNTFHSHGGDDLNWVQWRNELFGWFIYEDFIKNGKVFDSRELPGLHLIESATINARYRFRADPVYSIREHYSNIFDAETKESFIFPENGFRDLFLDVDFGSVGPGRLSMRIGNQQIVWGESDLFRSIDRINPLRIDQNQGAGEKFDEFRTPLPAIKFFYEIGTVGTWFSNVAIEPFWTPKFRNGTSHLILEGAWKVPHHIKGCLNERDEVVPYRLGMCDKLRASNGERVFVPWRPGWRGQRNITNPWSIFAAGPNPNSGTPDFGCLTQRCSPDILGERVSLLANLNKGRFRHDLRGWGQHAGGARIVGTSTWGVDFSLNYMYLPEGPTGTFDMNNIFQEDGSFQPGIVFGDFAFGGQEPAGDLAAGLRRCLSNNGKNHETKTKDRGHKVSTVLTGVDVFGYNNPQRRVDAEGNPLPGAHHAVRGIDRNQQLTFCFPGKHDWIHTHVIGFTLTYNDFEYTGAVFRAEQSYSTSEVIRFIPAGNGRRVGDPFDPAVRRDDFARTTGVWRSMLGFDLFQSIKAFRYIPGIHRSFYEQAWFLSGQYLMENYWHNVANNFCSNIDDVGNGLTEAEIDAMPDSFRNGVRVAYSNPQCRRYRWNHLFTLGLANQGLFGSRVETRNAIAFEPREKQTLLFSQWWWRNVLGHPNIELSAGVAWYTGTSIGDSWSSLQYFADKDQFWFEFTYYLL